MVYCQSLIPIWRLASLSLQLHLQAIDSVHWTLKREISWVLSLFPRKWTWLINICQFQAVTKTNSESNYIVWHKILQCFLVYSDTNLWQALGLFQLAIGLFTLFILYVHMYLFSFLIKLLFFINNTFLYFFSA